MRLSLSLILGLTVFSPSSVLGISVLYDLPNAHATAYYDLTNQLCGNAAAGDPFPANWAENTGINAGIPFRQGSTVKTLKDLGTNRIVAMNGNMVTGDPSKYCGKEVQIIQADGSPMIFDEGPLFIWDACAACSGSPIIDLSAKAFTQLKGGTCAGNNPGGFRVQILDNNIWEAGSGGGGVEGGNKGGGTNQSIPQPVPHPQPSLETSPNPAPPPSFSSSYSSSSTSHLVEKPGPTEGGTKDRPTLTHNDDDLVKTDISSFTKTSTSSIGVSTIVEVPISTDVTQNCKFGAWQCNGLSLEVCNYVELYKLDWQRIDMCDSKCEITESGSVDCE